MYFFFLHLGVKKDKGVRNEKKNMGCAVQDIFLACRGSACPLRVTVNQLKTSSE